MWCCPGTKPVLQSVPAGGAPDREIVHGAMIVLAGLLLIIPGFITDIIGLLLFLPPVRDLAWNTIRSRIVVVGTGFSMRGAQARRETKVIDLDEQDYREINDNGPSPWRRPDTE